MASLAAETPEFEEFVQTACAVKGCEIDRTWLQEVWTGADCSIDRAVNHVLDTPDDKLKKADAGFSPGAFPPPAGDTSFVDDGVYSAGVRDKKSKKDKKVKKKMQGGPEVGGDVADPWGMGEDASHDVWGGASDFPAPKPDGDAFGGFPDHPDAEWGANAFQFESKPAAEVPEFSDWGAASAASQPANFAADPWAEQQQVSGSHAGGPENTSNQFGFGAESSDANFDEGYGIMVESESDSENEWWHMPTLRNFLTPSNGQLDAMVSDSYSRHCPSGRGGINEIQAIAQEIAYYSRVSAGAFRSLEMMHERFDFSGDGTIDAEEAVQLVKACLRYFYMENNPRGNKAKDMKLPRKNIEDEFALVKKLGQGGQGAMFLVRVHGRADELRCIKSYEKGNANAPLDSIKEEFDLMRRLESPFVARTYEIFEDQVNVYLVSEPYFGGDLTKLIANASQAGAQLTEDWFKRVLSQPVRGIQYLNQKHLMHCDLKEPNVMVANDSNWEQPHVVLIDFGLAMNFAGPTYGVCGTPGYISPEAWQKGYWVPKGDVFSLGVIFFQILSGIDQLFVAFMGARTMEDIVNATCNELPPFDVLSDKPDFQELVGYMLEKEPQQRCTIFQVLQHSWFNKEGAGGAVSPQVFQYVQEASRKTEAELQLAELMLERYNLGNLHDLNNAFMAMDQDNSGIITSEEAKQASSSVAGRLGTTQADLELLLLGLADSSGNISYRRFMAALIHQQRGFNVTDLWSRFCQIDTDRNGVLDRGELEKVIRMMNYPEQDAWNLMQSLDTDNNGFITFEEFKRAVMG